MLTVFISILLTAIGPFYESRAFAEGTARGGADHNVDPAHAWFTGDQVIRYCIELSPSFGKDAKTAQAEIETAFVHWERYLSMRKINDHRPSSSNITLMRQALAQCDGTQNLKFYLGSSDPLVDSIKQKSHPNALAFGKDMPPNQSLIWISPTQSMGGDWSKPDLFQGTLLHEIGHLVGNDYVPNTIMDPSFADRLSQGGDTDWLRHIDGNVILYDCESCAHHGVISKEPDEVRHAFKLFVGRNPVGKVSVTYTYRPNGDENASPMLTLTDGRGSKSVRIKYNQDKSAAWSRFEQTLDLNAIMATTLGASSTCDPTGGRNAAPVEITGRHFEIGMGRGGIRTADGKELPLDMVAGFESAGSKAPIQLYYRVGADTHSLFQMTPDE